MYVLDMVGTIILFIKEMYGNVWKCMEMYGNVWKCMEIGRELFQWSSGDANKLFIFIWPKQCLPASRDK